MLIIRLKFVLQRSGGVHRARVCACRRVVAPRADAACACVRRAASAVCGLSRRPAPRPAPPPPRPQPAPPSHVPGPMCFNLCMHIIRLLFDITNSCSVEAEVPEHSLLITSISYTISDTLTYLGVGLSIFIFFIPEQF